MQKQSNLNKSKKKFIELNFVVLGFCHIGTNVVEVKAFMAFSQLLPMDVTSATCDLKVRPLFRVTLKLLV